MERLSIDEVIEHCRKTCEMTERISKARGHELESIESKQFWEHYQVREWLKELKEYKQLEEQGLLLQLPCKVGDTIYYIEDNVIYEFIVYSFDIRPLQEFVCNYGGIRFNLKNFGKTVFITRSEAEQKLKMDGSHDGIKVFSDCTVN